MGKLGDAISGISGKDALKGFASAFGGLSGVGRDNPMAGAMGGLSGLQGGSGLNLMSMLFDSLGIFGRKKEGEDTPSYNPTGIVGPR